ncbi:hypothetical protein SLA2020_172610 [Shorea laevis]
MPAMEFQTSADEEVGRSHSNGERGGWITFPFIAATLMGLMLAGNGWMTNLIVYLIEEFKVKSIDAAQITNILNGSVCILPIIAAILADSFFGNFPVVAISSFFSLLGVVLLTSTASVNSLRPHCATGSSFCQAPSRVQFAVLYAAIALATIGQGAMRFTLATLGANQFDKPQHQGVYFNWFFCIFFASGILSSSIIVYVEDSISWGLGFGICAASNFVGLVIFLLGNRFYKHDKPQGSPYTGLARVIVAAIQKRNIPLSSISEDYYHEKDERSKTMGATPPQSLRFLNRAALKTDEDIKSDGSIVKSWRLCTVEEVENLKALLRIFPLWSSTLFLSTPLAILLSMTVLQALAMDRRLGSNFKIPAGSTVVVALISNCFFLSIFDKIFLPTWRKLARRSLTPLQRIGIGHVLNVLSLAIAALVESRRLKIANAKHIQAQPGAIVPMPVLWLFPQFVVSGLADVFYFPGQVTLYYQEFPVSLRSTATAMISLILAIAYYVSTALVDLIRNVTGWLPNNINEGRLDKVYWTLCMIGSLNFGYYLVCSWLYRYRNIEEEMARSVNEDNEETKQEG